MFPVPPLVFAETAVRSSAVQQVWKFFSDGGLFMALLGVCSVVAVAAIFFKILTLRRESIIPEGLAREVDDFEARIRKGNVEAVLGEFEEGKSTLARLSAVAVRHRGKPQSEIAEAVQAVAREEVVHMTAGMTALDVVVTVAPLLGLLGTASGLVVVFGGLGDTADHTAIARGIGRALNTTIVGLAIAVPVVVAQGWFQRRIDTMAARLEVLLTKLGHVCERSPRPGPQPDVWSTPSA